MGLWALLIIVHVCLLHLLMDADVLVVSVGNRPGVLMIMVQLCLLDLLIRTQVCSLVILDLLVSQVVHFVIGSFKMALSLSSCKALSLKGTHINYT